MPKRVYLTPEVEPALVRLIADDDRFSVTDSAAAAEVMVTRTVNRVDAKLLSKAPNVRVIAQATSGIDNIDTDAASAAGIEILHLPGINANAVAELVVGEMIALTRTLPSYHREVLGGRWNRTDCATRHELRHYRLGIIGFGHVGSRVAALASAFGMSSVALDPFLDSVSPASRASSLDELLGAADIVTIHVPLTAETRGMIGSAAIARMRPGSILINAARGEVLDIDAALAALASGQLGGLAIDVYDVEPPSRGWPDLPQLLLTPHIAGCTHEAKSASSSRLHAELVRWADSH